jgi:hypothetical protein
MSTAIHTQLASLRTRIRLTVAAIGLGWLVVALGAAVGAACLLDWQLHLPADLRLLLLLGAVGLTGWTVWRCLWRPLTTPLGDVQLAIRVEQTHPELEERLSSAVEFLAAGPDSGWSGSPVLVRATVDQALGDAQQVSFTDVVRLDPLRRSLGAALAVLLVVMGLGVAGPESSRIALARFVNPFTQTQWPKRTYLAVVEAPEQVAKGENFQFTIGVRKGVVPRKLTVHYEFEGGEQAEDSLAANAQGQFIGTLGRVTRPFSFYAECDEDRTDTRRVALIERPKLQGLTLTCTYPKYTGQAPETLRPGQGNVSAVWGTQVSLSAATNKPITAAAFTFPRQRPADARLTFTQRAVSGRFRITADAGYNIRVRDEALESLSRGFYRITCVKDRAPSVFIDKPGVDKQVTSRARVRLKVVAKDDWGMQQIGLSRQTGATKTSANPSPVDVLLYKGEGRPRQHMTEYMLDLAPMKLSHGSVVEYWAWATDTDNLNGPHRGKSRTFRLLIVSPERMAQILDNQLLQLRQEIEQVVQLQQQVHGPVQDTAEKLRTRKRLDRADGDLLQNQELGQRQIEHKITNRADGLRGRAEQILADMDQNRLRDPARRTRVERILDTLVGLSETVVPDATRQLTHARKSAQGAGADAKQARTQAGEQQKALDRAVADQREILAGLREMLRRLDKWETYREVLADATDLLKRQQQVNTRTRQVGRQTVGKPLAKLSASEKVALGKAGRDQNQTAERLARLHKKMDRLAERTRRTDPLASENLREAMGQSMRRGTRARMSEAGRQIGANRMGAATAAQKQIAKDLKELVDSLKHGRQRELARLLKRLKEAEKKLQALRGRQLAHLGRNRELEKAKPTPTQSVQRLTREQRTTQQQTSQTAQRLEALRAEQAGQKSAKAADEMRKAAGSLSKGKAGGASKGHQKKAIDELEKAIQALAQKRKQIEQELANEQVAQMADVLKQMLRQQTQTHKDTTELDGQRRKKPLTRGQLRSLAIVARSQRTLASEAKEAAGKLDQAPVFRLVVARVRDDMDSAAGALKQRHTGPNSQQPQRRAIGKLKQLIDSFKRNPGEGEKKGGQGGGGQGGRGRGPLVPPLAQLKMLKTLQLELNEQTRRLDRDARVDKKWTHEEAVRIKNLAAEQDVLGELLREMVEGARQAAMPKPMKEKPKSERKDQP